MQSAPDPHLVITMALRAGPLFHHGLRFRAYVFGVFHLMHFNAAAGPPASARGVHILSIFFPY